MIKVKLDEIIEQFTLLNNAGVCVLNKKTGEILTVSEEYLQYAEDDTFDPEDLSDWEQEEIALAKDILNNPGDYISFPDASETDEYQVMREFCYFIKIEDVGMQLLDSIKEKGALRQFEENVNRLGFREEWEKFREGIFKQKAVEWCRKHKIEYF
jgi:hypothetical protein